MLHLLLLVHLLHELLLLLLVGFNNLLLLLGMVSGHCVLCLLGVLLLSQDSSLILGHTAAAAVYTLVLLLGVDRFKKGLPGTVAIGAHRAPRHRLASRLQCHFLDRSLRHHH